MRIKQTKQKIMPSSQFYLRYLYRIPQFICTIFFVLLVACGGGSDDDSSNQDDVNTAPIANAGDDQSVIVDATVELSGSGSTDADGDALTYVWTLTSLPDGSNASLNNATSISTNFITDIAGDYVVSLVVNDGTTSSAADTVTVTAVNVNNAPVANAGTNQAVFTNQVVSLNGSQSSDVDGDSLTYSWSFSSIPTDSNATLSQDGSDQDTFTPDIDGEYIVDLIVNDGELDSEIDSILVTSVTSNNAAPVADSKTMITDEDTASTTELTATDDDGDILTYRLVSSPTKGTVTLNNQRINFIPFDQENRSDSFTFVANDGFQDSNIATVSVEINAINDKPIAYDYSLSTVIDTEIDIALRTDDKEGDSLTYSIISQPVNGSVSLTDSTASYTPSTSYTGSDSFSFRVNDGTNDSNIATVTVTTLETANTPPVVASKNTVVSEDDESVIDLSDSENLPKADKSVADGLVYSVVEKPLHGEVVINGSSATFTPNSDYSGTDSFKFKSNDGNDDSNHGTITLNVTSLNDAPIANDFSISTVQDSAVSFVLTSTDTEFDELSFFIVEEPVNGTITLTDSTVVYTPNTEFVGDDYFTFKTNDGNSDSNIATVSVSVTEGVNSAPEADDTETSTEEDNAIQIDLIVSDLEGDALTYAIVSAPSNGVASISDSVVTYTPNNNYNGEDTLTFKANDGVNDSNVALVIISVIAVNDAPTVNDVEVNINESVSTNITLIGGDAEDDDLTYDIVAQPNFGQVTINENIATYVPSTGYTGEDSFTYMATDGNSESNVATISINLLAVNEAPIAEDGSASIDEDSGVEISLFATDPDDDDLSYSIVANPANGNVTIDGAVAIYTPLADYNGNDSFSFVANDGNVNSNTAIVSITINAINDLPVVSDQEASTNEDTEVEIELIATDVDGDSVTFSIASDLGAENGQVLLNGSTATFTPDADFSGVGSFTFFAYDGVGYSEVATVSIIVNQVNDAPVTSALNESTPIDTALEISLVATDVENDSLTYSIVSNPTNGTVALSGSTATYTPTTSFTGSDSFTYKANDGTEDSNISTVSIDVVNATACATVTPVYSYTIVDTNQTLCYDEVTGDIEDCVGEGQDGDYSGNQPSYTSCSAGEIVVDNHTGLMWQASSDTDGVSGLNRDDQMSRDDAETYCEDLTLGGYSDWRLPSTKTLVSIYLMSGEDLSGKSGATSNGTTVDTTGIEPFINTNYFDVGYGDPDAGERMIDGQYATSTLNKEQIFSGITYSEKDGFFGINFVDGHIKSYETDPSFGNFYARCVRGNEEYGVNEFTDNEDGTISDSATNLMWQQTVSNTPASNFSDAVSSCEAASTGGYNDWRLPNMKELHSILDYTRAPTDGDLSEPAIDRSYFNVGIKTNEAGVGDWPAFWTSTALLNYLGSGNKAAYITFGRGMGYFSNYGPVDVHGAGAQRSDGKTTAALNSAMTFTPDASSSFGSTAYTSGPQGDVLRPAYNSVRCVRDE